MALEAQDSCPFPSVKVCFTWLQTVVTPCSQYLFMRIVTKGDESN